jgi:Holliday junction resolvase RusA-like endonuclease
MPHQQKPDKDNLEKAFMDSFSIDDSFVYDGRTCKFWSDKPMIVIF